MSRGIGEFGPIQEYIPEWAAPLLAFLTQFGDVWFLTLVLAGLYWRYTDQRNDIAVVAGITIAGVGLYKGLKEIFALPRPEQPLLDPELLPWIIRPLYESTAIAGGYGFPSGHALNTTIVYFGLATVLTVSRRRYRYLGAAILVFIVSFTRVTLGVHYLVDVVAGVSLGLVFLFGMYRLLNELSHRASYSIDRATAAFGFGILFSTFFFAMSPANWEAIALFGVSLGVFAAWRLFGLDSVDRVSVTTRAN